MEKPVSIDRRNASRIPVSLYLDEFVENESHRCFSTSLSKSGLYMERPMQPFVRRTNQVRLEIPDPEGQSPLMAEAEVVYDCFDGLFHGTAVRFTAMSEHDRHRLDRWVTAELNTPQV